MLSIIIRMSRKMHKIVCIFVLAFFLFVPHYHAQASAWGVNEANNWVIKQYGTIEAQVKAIIFSAAKKAVTKVLNTQIIASISVGPDGVRFITNWQSYLSTDPQSKAEAYMNTFFNSTTGGKSSSLNYAPAGGAGLESGFDSDGNTLQKAGGEVQAALSPAKRSWLAREGIVATAHAAPEAGDWTITPGETQCVSGSCLYGGGESYEKYLVAAGKNATVNQTAPVSDLGNYCANGPSSAFAQGDWRCWSSFFSNPMNNPMGYALKSQEVYQSELAKQQMLAYAQSQAYDGYKASVGSDGVSVTTPGITIGRVVEAASNLSIDNLANAKEIQELVVDMATSVIDQAVNGLVDYAQTAVEGTIDQGLRLAENAVNGVVDSTFSGSFSASSNGGVGLSVGATSLANVNWDSAGVALPTLGGASQAALGGASKAFNENINGALNNGHFSSKPATTTTDTTTTDTEGGSAAADTWTINSKETVKTR
jgi:hypothetical protein